LLNPGTPAISTTCQELTTGGLPVTLPAGGALLLEWN